ncbi:MAG TPA: DUF4236 domain-containing protein [Brachyspira hyodysenteriae]|nr:DUF4236 domain-containing protein [Brachyspira hyodysenteriae]
MRFRKSFKIGKGFKINLSKSGLSTTIGGKGLSVNIGKKGGYLNTSIPGTGLYSRNKIFGSSKNKNNSYHTEEESYNNDNISNNDIIDINNIKKKDKERAIILSVLSATCLPFGLHKFYLGLYKQGIIYSLFFWTLIPQIISLVEFFLFIKMKDEDFDKKYNIPYLIYLEQEHRKEVYQEILKECQHIEHISTDIDNSLTKDEKCFLKSDYSKWYEYRKIKGDESLELIYSGIFYLTNKKIIFVTSTEVKKIELKDIIQIICNEDNINISNVVELTKIKGKNVILEFTELEMMFKVYFIVSAHINNLLKLDKEERTEE